MRVWLLLYRYVTSSPLSYRWRALCGAWGIMSQTNGGSDQRGLAALVMLLRFQGLSVDPGQIRHQLGTDAVGSLRCCAAPTSSA